MKKLILGLLAAITITLSAGAAQLTTVVNGQQAFSLLTGAGRISQFVITGSPTNNTTYTFYDAPSTNQTYVLGAYSNIVTSVGLYTNVYTNYFGILTTNSYTAQTSTTNSVPQTTNTYNVLMSALVTSNTTLTIGNANTFPYGSVYYFYQGVMVTNNVPGNGGASSVTLTYQQ